MLKSILSWISGEKEPPKETPRTMPNLITGIRTKKAPIPPGTPTMEVLLKHKEGPEYQIVGISYTDAEGVTTERVISILSIINYEDNPRYKTIEAHCHSRGAVRHFRTDRINHFFDPNTGEIFQNVNLKSILKSPKGYE